MRGALQVAQMGAGPQVDDGQVVETVVEADGDDGVVAVRVPPP